MRLTHRFRLPVPLDQAWDAFSDLVQLAPCFPGATLTNSGPDQFHGSLNVKLGPVPLLYRGTGTYLERSAGRHRVVVQAHGDDLRGLGNAAVQVSISLSEHDAQTDVEVVTELDLTGKPARYGSTVVSEAAGKLLDQFAGCLAGRLSSGSASAVRVQTVLAETGGRAAAPDRARRAKPTGGARVGGPAATVAAETAGSITAASAPRLSAVTALVRRYGVALGATGLAVVVLRLLRRR